MTSCSEKWIKRYFALSKTVYAAILKGAFTFNLTSGD